MPSIGIIKISLKEEFLSKVFPIKTKLNLPVSRKLSQFFDGEDNLIKLTEKEKVELDWWENQSLFGKNYAERGKPSKRAYDKYRNIVLLSGGDKFSFEDKIIIDIGCGPMGALHFFPETSIKIGIDNLALSYNRVFEVKEKQDLEYITADGEFLPISEKCADYVFCINALDHVDEPHAVAVEIERILKPNGVLFLQTEINKVSTTLNEPHILETDTIINLFSNFSLQHHRVIPRQKTNFYRFILKLLGIYPRYEDVLIASFIK